MRSAVMPTAGLHPRFPGTMVRPSARLIERPKVQRAHATEEGARLSKFLAVSAIMATLAGFSSLSYSFSQDRAQHMECAENQRLMCTAVLEYQADNAGLNPPRLRLAQRYYTGRPGNFGACPVDYVQYQYDRTTGIVRCTNPAHQPHDAMRAHAGMGGPR